jgi:hypothetical protein
MNNFHPPARNFTSTESRGANMWEVGVEAARQRKADRVAITLVITGFLIIVAIFTAPVILWFMGVK